MTDSRTLDDLDIPGRVAHGVSLLDEKRPGWWQRIDLDDLDVNDCSECVIGQLFAGFVEGATSLIGADEFMNNLNAPALIALGFSVPMSNNDTEADALTAEWKRIISERRVEASPS